MKKFPKNIFDGINENKYLSDRQKLILKILQLYNCRISEILNATWEDYYPGKFLILRGLKNSSDIFVRDIEINRSLASLGRLHATFIFYPVKYYQIYRYCLRLLNNRAYVKGYERNRKVTHFFRYENANILKHPEDATAMLHHKSKRSASYYLTNQRSKPNATQPR